MGSKVGANLTSCVSTSSVLLTRMDILKSKLEPESNLNRPNYRSIWVFGFGFNFYVCYILGV